MAYEQKDDTGSLFKNDKREKETHANARGSARIGGVDYWVDAWTNTTNSGNKYQSLKFKRKDQQQGGAAAPAATTQRGTSFDDLDGDDVPFATNSALQEWKVG